MRKVLLPLALVLMAPVPPPEAAAAGETPRVVKLKTADGMTLDADWYSGEAGMPGVVGLHMFQSDRSTWKPLADRRPAGWHFLAVDMRGHGGSRMQGGKDISDRVKKKDEQLFQGMWQDALAAVAYLRDEAKCDPKRIGLVGASVGCSVAIDATIRRGQDIAAVCALTPGTAYLGVPTMDHVKSWRDQPLLLLSSEKEADGGARPIADALRRNPEVEVRVVPGEDIHGTKMFGKVDGIEDRITSWFEAVLGREILDGVADPVEKKVLPGRGREEAPEKAMGQTFILRMDAKGVNILGEGTFNPAFVLFVDPGATEAGFRPGSKRLRGMGSASGALLGTCVDTWNEGAWVVQTLGSRPGVAMVTDKAMEIRIPWRMLGIEPGGGRVCVGFSTINRRPDWQAAPETWTEVVGTVLEVPK
jgi:pimeloyl-ACP methyl ester carboxylesterase